MSAHYLWPMTVTAMSSIAHTGDTQGIVSLLRREKVVQPDGRQLLVPLISGNTVRGRLRRISESLFRDAVGYAGEISVAAAHALRGGGSLAKTGQEPLSGARLARVRACNPHLGLFGAAAGGTVIDGCLQVGKLLPRILETSHITGATSTTSLFNATQLEFYTRQSDADTHEFAGIAAASLDLDPATGAPIPPAAGANQMLYRVETFPAGTQFSTRIGLIRPTPLELALFVDVLAAFEAYGRIGGRASVGLGEFRLDYTSPALPAELPDWRAWCAEHRDEILDTLTQLT